MRSSKLPIHDLAERHPGVTRAVSDSYAEAARVCLDRHHISPVDFVLIRGSSVEVVVDWTATDERTKGAWANETDATEAGAYCIALAAIETTDGLLAVSRSETRTGADYYLGYSEHLEDLERSCRLEVSGVDAGALSVLQSRLRAKREQAAAGKSSLPAIAAVVGFSAKRVLIGDVELE
jgi:hypothetical protein